MARYGNITASVNTSGAYIGANRPRTRPMQGRAKDQDVSGSTKYSCSECRIFYYMPEGSKAICPLCSQNRYIVKLEEDAFQERNRLNAAFNEIERLKVQVDTLSAMKVALEATSVEDLTFLKSVLYRWQDERRNVALKPTHAAPKGRGKKSKVDGFIALFRGSDPEVHQCNSVGGLALAGYLEEAIMLGGQMDAMKVLARALLKHLEVTDLG